MFCVIMATETYVLSRHASGDTRHGSTDGAARADLEQRIQEAFIQRAPANFLVHERRQLLPHQRQDFIREVDRL